MNLIFYHKCHSPHLPTVTGKGGPKSQTGKVSLFCTESSWGTTISGGMFYAAAWRNDGISASTKDIWLEYINAAIENSATDIRLIYSHKQIMIFYNYVLQKSLQPKKEILILFSALNALEDNCSSA